MALKKGNGIYISFFWFGSSFELSVCAMHTGSWICLERTLLVNQWRRLVQEFNHYVHCAAGIVVVIDQSMG